jgi:nucleoid-associated protein YgaU
VALEKAYLTFIQPSSSGGAAGGSASVNGKSKIDFQFNPKEYSIKKSANWSRSDSPGAKKTAPPEFRGAGPSSMSLELFLDGTATNEDVSGDVDTLFACLQPLPQAVSSNKPSPPFVQFGWGGKVHFVAFMKSVSAKYTLFKSDGIPLRAICTVELEEFPVNQGAQNPTSGGLAALRTHLVVSGDSLQSVAYREYGDATMWRLLAEENQIDDPQRLSTGTQLRVPLPGMPSIPSQN